MIDTLMTLDEAELKTLADEYSHMDETIIRRCTSCGITPMCADEPDTCTDCLMAEAHDTALAEFWKEGGQGEMPERFEAYPHLTD